MTEAFDTHLDCITLRGVRGHGHHGVLAEERVMGQEFIVDVTLGVPAMSRAAGSDDLADTVDYASVAVAVKHVVEGESVNLIERLAAVIADRCLQFEPVRVATVTVHKPNAPIPVQFDDVSVTITRTR